jgi:hypothetical protein
MFGRLHLKGRGVFSATHVMYCVEGTWHRWSHRVVFVKHSLCGLFCWHSDTFQNRFLSELQTKDWSSAKYWTLLRNMERKRMFQLWRQKKYVPPKRQCPTMGLNHYVIIQKTTTSVFVAVTVPPLTISVLPSEQLFSTVGPCGTLELE